jgi:hypothetical protein
MRFEDAEGVGCQILPAEEFGKNLPSGAGSLGRDRDPPSLSEELT